MKPSDLFVGSRQLFGYLVPGAIWAGIIWTLAVEEPAKIVREATTMEVVLFLAVSFVTGYVFQLLSFARVCALAEHVGRRRSIYIDAPELQQVRDWLQAEGTIWLGSSPVLSDERVAAFCKRWVLEKSEHLRNEVVELENEVNLLVAVIPPLTAFPIVMLAVAMLATFEIGLAAWTFEVEIWILAALSTATAVLLLGRLHSMRRNEITLWVASFVDLQLARKVSRPQAAPSSPVTPAS
jgi:hypothetical protein